ncbi:FHA domain-containing protein [Aliiglaciecola lipolytica]|uniref:FHA domain-containing protein n=1 Tax=Aliiglaciecola lipolytica TaxID=477689 RepID=UPI001C08590D|nr:FHA domain-containing protein [Aliiglaciecola lipolytica]MBU2876225.1 FHA domain-containing protein [Aliiglaciecola lipolytica]
MAIVVEVLSKNGKVLSYQTFEKEKISIGRAYDNDVRIDDPYVCPEHILIQAEDDTEALVLTDVDSLNGVKINGSPGANALIGFDDIVTIGRSRLRIFKNTQKVSPAIVLSKLEEKMEWLSMRRLCAGLAIVFIALVSANFYFNSIVEVNVSQVVKVSLSAAAAACIWPFSFALLSILAKKDAHIVSQFNLLWLFLISHELLSYLQAILQFNLSSVQFIYWFILLIKGALFFAFLWFTLFIAFHQSKRMRNSISITGTALLAMYVLAPHLFNTQNFVAAPRYTSQVLSPIFRITAPETTEKFVERSDKLIEGLKQEVEKGKE